MIARELDRPNSRLSIDVEGGFLLVVTEDQQVREQLEVEIADWEEVDDRRWEGIWQGDIEGNPDPLGIVARRQAWKEAHG